MLPRDSHILSTGRAAKGFTSQPLTGPRSKFDWKIRFLEAVYSVDSAKSYPIDINIIFDLN